MTAKKLLETPNPLYPPNQAAVLLGVLGDDGITPRGETIREWCRKGKYLQPGTEALKVGGKWKIDVIAYKARLAKEQAQPRQV